MAFADEAGHFGAVFELEFADAEGCGDAGDEGAEVFCGDGPDFDVDRCAAGNYAGKTGTERRAAGECVEAIHRRGACSFEQRRATGRKLVVERQAFEVRAADGDGDALRCVRRGRRRRASAAR